MNNFDDISCNMNGINNNHQIINVETLKKHQIYDLIKNYLWIFPLYCSIGLLVITIVPYALSVSYGHTNPIFPFVSDSGGYPPGASIFASILSLGAICALVSAWIRYKQMKYYLRLQWKSIDENNNLNNLKGDERNLINRLMNINFYQLIIMLISSFGIILTATFRSTELKALTVVHSVGSAITIMSQLLYITCNTYLAGKLFRNYSIETYPYSLIATLILQSIFSTVFLVNFLYIWFLYGDKFMEPEYRLQWTQNDDQIRFYYLSATISETVLFILLSFSWLCLTVRIGRFKHWQQIRF